MRGICRPGSQVVRGDGGVPGTDGPGVITIEIGGAVVTRKLTSLLINLREDRSH
jgi:hypothetical protein